MPEQPIIEKLEITKLEARDARSIDEAWQLMNRTQGQGLFAVSYLTEKIDSDEATVLIGKIDGTLVAVGCARIIHSFGYYAPFGSKVPQSFDGHKVGSLCAMSVLEEFQGRGIGQIMTKHRLSWMEDQNCDVVVGISWVSGLKNTSARVFEKTGFAAVAEATDFYKEDSLQKPFDCPGCRHKPCKCSAILYRRDLLHAPAERL